MDLSIICVNWNSVDYLQECLTSIYQSTQEVSFEIVIVDNASPNGDVDSLKGAFPGIQIVKCKENAGFARANNLGFRHSSGRYLLFLNPDTRLMGPAIDVMLREAGRIPDMGILGCKLLDSDLSVQTESIQRFPTILNQLLDVHCLRMRWPACRLWDIGPLFVEHSEPVRVEVIPGACMLLKREVFEAAGGFSEEYFMYAEDIDLNYKVSRLGLGSYYVGQARVIHHGGTSSGQQKVSQWATAMKFRAMVAFYSKTRGRFYAGMYRASMACAALGRLAVLLPAILFGGFVRKREGAARASAKWGTILRCAVGLS